MSAVDPSVASTIPLFVILFRTSPELIVDLSRMLGPFQRGLRKLIVDYFHRSDGAPGCDMKRDASSGVGPGYTRGKDCAGLALTPSNYSNTLKAHCGFISIDLMARQTPTSSKNVCCGSQRSIDNSTFFIFFSNTKKNNDACIPHTRTTLERPPEADCGLFPSIYWRARFRQPARREFRSRARVHSREGWCGVSPNTLKID